MFSGGLFISRGFAAATVLSFLAVTLPASALPIDSAVYNDADGGAQIIKVKSTSSSSGSGSRSSSGSSGFTRSAPAPNYGGGSFNKNTTSFPAPNNTGASQYTPPPVRSAPPPLPPPPAVTKSIPPPLPPSQNSEHSEHKDLPLPPAVTKSTPPPPSPVQNIPPPPAVTKTSPPPLPPSQNSPPPLPADTNTKSVPAPPSVVKTVPPPPPVVKEVPSPPSVTRDVPAQKQQTPPSQSQPSLAQKPPSQGGFLPPPPPPVGMNTNAIPRTTKAGNLEWKDPADPNNRIVTDKSGKVLFDQHVGPRGETVIKDNKQGVTVTKFADGSKKVENGVTGTITEHRREPDGSISVWVTPPGGTPYKKYSESSQERTWVGSNGQTVHNHYYQPTTPYFDSGCDTFCQLLILQALNNHNNGNYNNGGGGYSGSYGDAAHPTQTVVPSFDWGRIYPYLPAEMRTSPPYTDPMQWVSDSVVYGIINDERSIPDKYKKQFCNWFTKMFWCKDPQVEPLSEQYLNSMRQFELDVNTRNDIYNHTAALVASLKDHKQIGTDDLVDVETGVVKQPRIYVIGETRKVTDDQENVCGLGAGDVVQLKSIEAHPTTFEAKVIKTIEDGDEDGCRAGSTVKFEFHDLEEMENNFASRVEKSITDSRQQLAGLKH